MESSKEYKRAMLGALCIELIGKDGDGSVRVPNLHKWYDRMIAPRATEKVIRDAYEMGMQEADENSRKLVADAVDAMLEQQSQVRAVMSLLGSRRSERKAASSRQNGKKGGRPPKKKQ